MPNKFGAAICDEKFGLPKAGPNLLANKADDDGGGMVSCCQGHWPVSEVVNGSDNVLLSQSVFGKWPHNVKGPLLKGFHFLDGQDRLGGCRFERVLFAQHARFEEIQDVLMHAQPPNLLFHDLKEVKPSDVTQGLVFVVNIAIHHVLILPLVGHFEEKSLAFAFASQNELMTESGSTIFWFLDPAQLTLPPHADGK
ncbi:hypothetical protein DSO57_1014005 [Entomophthora muscae]|uniref:Uncharacterized protein n=1 Tax=Entomophthora muscae TaxID=34485 RepID=A0ACC2SIZ1_9FUNG|nr:hypothetical protein DSO57_1014005 [Entomophthora muscae]